MEVRSVITVEISDFVLYLSTRLSARKVPTSPRPEIRSDKGIFRYLFSLEKPIYNSGSMSSVSKGVTVLLLVVSVSGPPCLAQADTPKNLTLHDLTANPKRFNGTLVRVRASALIGWEGDTFLIEPHGPANAKPELTDQSAAPIWIDCGSSQSYKACNGLRGIEHGSATFIGRFRYVPNDAGRGNAMFDPGPFQLEVVRITEIQYADRPLEPMFSPDKWW